MTRFEALYSLVTIPTPTFLPTATEATATNRVIRLAVSARAKMMKMIPQVLGLFKVAKVGRGDVVLLVEMVVVVDGTEEVNHELLLF